MSNTPFFSHVPRTLMERWEFIREFIRRWYEVPLPPVQVEVVPRCDEPIDMLIPLDQFFAPDYVLAFSVLQYASLVEDLRHVGGDEYDAVVLGHTPQLGWMEEAPLFVLWELPYPYHDRIACWRPDSGLPGDPPVELYPYSSGFGGWSELLTVSYSLTSEVLSSLTWSLRMASHAAGTDRPAEVVAELNEKHQQENWLVVEWEEIRLAAGPTSVEVIEWGWNEEGLRYYVTLVEPPPVET